MPDQANWKRGLNPDRGSGSEKQMELPHRNNQEDLVTDQTGRQKSQPFNECLLCARYFV